MAFSMAMPWNEGEEKMRQLLRVPDQDNPTSSMLTPQASFLLQRAPLLALGTLDSQGRPWTTLWGGRPGFSEPLGSGIIGTRTNVDGENDPVVQALVGDTAKGEMLQGSEKMISGLTIDLMTRKRVKIAGRVLASSLGEVNIETEDGVALPPGSPKHQDQLQLVTKIDQSLGNCPKYLNQYAIRPALVDNSKLISQSSSLSPEAKTLIAKADMFFLSTSTPSDMDTNHRGGTSGFVRILSSTSIIYPEYSGNRFYQSLGNLVMNPKIGITFPDYETGDVLYITGTAHILVAEDAAKVLPGSPLAVEISVEEARFVGGGLPFRGERKGNGASPYNPRVRGLASEGNVKSIHNSGSRKTIAQLIKKVKITPTIARFTFSVPEGIEYKAGQWVALDFSKELDIGYSHMRNDDPRSLNDDFVRTFTISSPASSSDTTREMEFDITIREVGPVTSYLFKQNDRAGFEVPVLGVGGEFRVTQGEGSGSGSVFIAGGVGITPLLGQINTLNLSPESFKLIWTVRIADVNLVVDTLKRYPELGRCMEVFVTIGVDVLGGEEDSKIEMLVEEKGIVVRKRRITKDDLVVEGASTWYVCAAKELRRDVLAWLEGKKVVFEDFDY
jgi:NAD(P)H-flavin reductase/predicted pyridoxine 5'-phosphate oxidase superfamily flavin-nucleotide-binding protein